MFNTYWNSYTFHWTLTLINILAMSTFFVECYYKITVFFQHIQYSVWWSTCSFCPIFSFIIMKLNCSATLSFGHLKLVASILIIWKHQPLKLHSYNGNFKKKETQHPTPPDSVHVSILPSTCMYPLPIALTFDSDVFVIA